MILTLHNVNFYQELMKSIRENIKNGTFDKFHDHYINKLWYLLNIDYFIKNTIRTIVRAVSSVGRAIPF